MTNNRGSRARLKTARLNALFSVSKNNDGLVFTHPAEHHLIGQTDADCDDAKPLALGQWCGCLPSMVTGPPGIK